MAELMLVGPKRMLPFKSVEEVLWAVFDVAEHKRVSFRSRIQQLQKLRLPWGVNVGRGGRALYSIQQVLEMMLYFDLFEAGVSPSALAAQFEQDPWFKRTDRFTYAVEQMHCGLVLVYHQNGLQHFRDDTRVGGGTDASDRSMVYALPADPKIRKEWLSYSKPRPLIQIYISRRMDDLFQAAGITAAEALASAE